MCKISVIMGCYNPSDRGKLYLAVNSVLKQTFKDFEFIICDDGSVDYGKNLIKSLEKLDTRVKVIRNEENKGLAFSLNQCIKIAKGEYIARMDDDDVSMENRLELEKEFLDRNKRIDFVGTNIKYIDDNNHVWGERYLKEYPVKEDLLLNSPFVHPSMMIRKSVFDKYGAYSVERITRRAEDYDLWMRLYSKGIKGANLQKNLLKYREGKTAGKKRKFIYRIDELCVRYRGFKRNHLYPLGLIYVLKPLIMGVIPYSVVKYIHKKDQVK